MIESSCSNGLEIHIVDVFAESTLGGNPAAIVTGADNLSDEWLQRIATFINLSETVFLFPPKRDKADYFARTFTVRREIPFAGHATLAAAHAVGTIRSGVTTLTQECSAGLLSVRLPGVECSTYTVGLPSPKVRTSELAVESIARALLFAADDLPPQQIVVASAGPSWLLTRVKHDKDLSRISVDLGAVASLTKAAGSVGLVVYSQGADGVIRLRAFAPAEGINEDPVCGSCAGAIAAYVASQGGTGELLFRQGTEIGRSGLMMASIESDGSEISIHLHGTCRTVIIGRMQF